MGFGLPYKYVHSVSTVPDAKWNANQIFNDDIRELKAKIPTLFMSQIMNVMFSNFKGRSHKWRHAIKLTDVLFGFTPARPLGPLAEFIGPVIPQQYKPLTSDLETYLEAHQRVNVERNTHDCISFFGDQTGNAIIVETRKLGDISKNDYSVEEAVDLFKRVIMNGTRKIAENVRRTQALVQIHSHNGVFRGADIVEEVAYTNKEERLPHIESADHRTSYLKSHNLDLYEALALIMFFTLWTFAFILKEIKLIFKPSSAEKVEIS
ncbi:hypothetical protein [Parasitella parasitica]|uniref:Uncharacterized protein n=1 Tax=Parasitella parasitica TaxID=35722 RepID=A0A0B7NHU9_9FUNG|nr:hypothetical protein [Parasitella parasitica]